MKDCLATLPNTHLSPLISDLSVPHQGGSSLRNIADYFLYRGVAEHDANQFAIFRTQSCG